MKINNFNFAPRFTSDLSNRKGSNDSALPPQEEVESKIDSMLNDDTKGPKVRELLTEAKQLLEQGDLQGADTLVQTAHYSKN